ncbi:hypothetical protein Pint_10876 [Pistacia integerrima]|uniref:Uncharacterized protein n=1 Tax=Pistacia integerrima TaxID=434235 RepID=A0ACC0XMU5_9ROSI|nr:hypothetical protein Pint_10876 [Pistacia integerrima]
MLGVFKFPAMQLWLMSIMA